MSTARVIGRLSLEGFSGALVDVSYVVQHVLERPEPGYQSCYIAHDVPAGQPGEAVRDLRLGREELDSVELPLSSNIKESDNTIDRSHKRGGPQLPKNNWRQQDTAFC